MKKEKNIDYSMSNNTHSFIKESVRRIIENTNSIEKINKLKNIHKVKTHFIPIRYRIFGGLLQSMNIQFGNFIEKLLHVIVENEKALTIFEEYSGKRSIKLSITEQSEIWIDNFITNCQNNNYDERQLSKNFNALLKKCIVFEEKNNTKEINIKHDIDILFSDELNQYFYLEVKYNDDHDTGKYADINRKFIKSYIGICNILKIYDINKFKPILFYLTNKKMKGNIYIPEYQNIYRGERLFNEFFSLSYADLDSQMQNISDNEDIIELFDNLYHNIRNEVTF